MTTHFIFDLVNVFPDQLHAVLRSIDVFRRENRISSSQISLIAFPRDKGDIEAAFSADLPPIFSVELPPGGANPHLRISAAVSGISAELRRQAEDQKPKEIKVVSFRGLVLKEIARTSIPSLKVETVNFPVISNYEARRLPPASSAKTWRYGHVATEREALQMMISALKARGATSKEKGVRQALIRDLLALTDPRFHGNAASTNTQGMVGYLVGVAANQGLIETLVVTPGDRVNPIIWATESTSLHTAPTPPELPPVTASETAVPPLAATTTLNLTNADSAPSQKVDGHPSIEAREESNPPAATPSASSTASEKIRQTLESIKYGPYPVARMALYDAIDVILNPSETDPSHQNEHSLRTLMREAIQLAPEMVARRQLDPTRQTAVWKHAAALVKRMILQSGALVDGDGNQVVVGLGADLAKIGPPPVDWRIRVDAEIVFAYISEIKEFCENSIEDLAGALFSNRDDASYEATVSAVRLLLQEKKLSVSSTGGTNYYRVATPPVAPPSVHQIGDEAAAHDGNGSALLLTRPR